jgi:SAM-dependent methyltransferase
MDLSKIKDLYEDSLAKHGRSPESVGWTMPGSQEMRFDKLLSVVDPKDEGFDVNELGCGYGELLPYAISQGYKLKGFDGYDISEKMIEQAKDHLAGYEQVNLYVDSAIHHKRDYTITSGIFNVKFEQSEDKWKEFIFQTLEMMMDNSNKGIAFNLLTSYVDFTVDHLFYADPMEFFDHCKRNLSKRVTLIHDYPLYEWTMIVRKDEA